ncbi:unnamed protein product [Microthlaspi erraticum]|uniref:TF-B3 domain-containing protein n=1 Tax=Microthlaspi erraticum TaxID=1685480 RepID=A0A6D2HZR2_9BRAS|nr:unnamed protein product [Microthlaspi erraticum]
MAMEEESFSKVLQIGDLSSDYMRAIPLDFVRRFSDSELLGKMKITAKWGTTWEVDICKNPGFFYMDKAGWNQFVSDNCLKGGDLITFTHKGAMCFSVKIFKEMLQPPQPTPPFFASFSGGGHRTEEQEECVSKDVNKEAESDGGRKFKTKLEKVVSVPRYSRGSSSSNVTGFTVVIQSSYFTKRLLGITHSFAKAHMPRTNASFKIHHPDEKKSWSVRYLPRIHPFLLNKWKPMFSSGWGVLVREYPLAIGDICTFTLIKPEEMLLVVTKPREEDSLMMI